MFWGRKVSNFFRELTQKNHKKVTFWQKTIPAKTMPTPLHPFSNNMNNEEQHQQPPIIFPPQACRCNASLRLVRPPNKKQPPPLFCPQIKRIKQIASAPLFLKQQINLIFLMADAPLFKQQDDLEQHQQLQFLGHRKQVDVMRASGSYDHPTKNNHPLFSVHRLNGLNR